MVVVMEGCFMRGFTAAFLVFAGTLNTMAEVVYENTRAYQTNFFSSLNEFGDELIFGGEARDLKELHFEYFAEFTPNGTQTATVRLYANDGPGIQPKPDRILTPGTVLHETDPIAISPGFNLLSIRGLSLPVPDKVTWSVQFAGLSDTPNDSAGLVFYQPPTVGESFDDFWQRDPAVGWRLFRFNGSPIANFACRAIVDPDSPVRIEVVGDAAGGGTQLRIEGPVGRSVEVQRSTDTVDWEPIHRITFVGTEEFVVDSAAGGSVPVEYRAVVLDETEVRIHSMKRVSARTRMEVTGPIDEWYVVEASEDFETWLAVRTDPFPAGIGTYSDASNRFHRFYRLRMSDGPALRFSDAKPMLVNGMFQVRVAGPPGRLCRIQASPDLLNWSDVADRFFSFTTGEITFLDTEIEPGVNRFYRARIE